MAKKMAKPYGCLLAVTSYSDVSIAAEQQIK